MNTPDLITIANGIAILGILSWISSGDVLRFGAIQLRNGSFWRCARWLGLGVWGIAINMDELWFSYGGWVALFGAICILIGSAQKRVTKKIKPNKTLHPTASS